ncbi:MAG: DUF4175 family protein [Acetobacteraceae bacterium]|nr:DUF4175 family protein [Acetobacteraceae bacterium]
MTEMPPGPAGLRWRRLLARVVLWFERLVPALLPAARVAGVFVCAALLDLPPLLPWWGHVALLAGTATAIVTLLWRGLIRLAPPGATAADRRLERDSGLTHRPLAALSDKPATDDPTSLALWRIHVARGLARVRRLRLDWPRPGLAALDRLALRNGVLLSLLTTLAIAGRDAPGRLMAAFEPGLPRAAATRPVEIQAWITPPAYTGLAPVFLKRDQASIAVPRGARLTVSLTGGTSVPDLVRDGESIAFASLDTASFQIEHALTQGGPVAITREGRHLAGWDIALIPDHPPVVRWTDTPGKSDAGGRIRLPWTVGDDYGVVTLRAELRLAARPDAPPIEITVPLPNGAPKAAHGLHQHDLIAHPWAGLGVSGRLLARDGSGQTGTSEDASFDLPERAFHNEIARALIQMRKGLSLHPDDRADAMAALDDLMQNPQRFGPDSGAFLNLSALYYLMVRNKSAGMVAEAQARMWELAIYLEEGQTEESARALETARQAVRDAMEKLAREPSDANREALEQRLKELRDAISRHMRAMQEEADRNHAALPFDPQAEQLSEQDLDRLAEEARQAAREGRMDDAREKMAELERMLDRLKQARADKGQGNSQQRQKGRRQMGAVQDMVSREGALLDHAEGRAEQPNRPGRIPPDSGEGDPAVQRPADQRVQRALRRALGEMMQQFGDLTGEIPPALTEADQAMREAGQRLGQGDDRGAAAAEQRAIEALQKGAREMGRALASQFGRGQQNGEGGEGDSFGAEGPMGFMMPNERGEGRSGGAPLPGSPNRADSRGRDPLGRTNQGNGLDSGDVRIPEEAERQRSQAIQEELRRRGAERERPRRELDYIDRLLRQF